MKFSINKNFDKFNALLFHFILYSKIINTLIFNFILWNKKQFLIDK
jgi:hypothetical protein